MKKILVLFALASFGLQAGAQTDRQTQVQVQVPSTVTTTFTTAYPSVESPVWRQSGNFYIVDYTQNSNPMYVMYDNNGKVVETGEGVMVTSYPAPLTTYVKTKYKDEKIEKVYKVKDANGKTLWKGKVKKDYILFDENGNYIKMEKD